MKKKLCVSLVLCLLLCLCVGTAAYASDAESGSQLNYVTDAAELLDYGDRVELETAAAGISEKYGCGVYVVIVYDYTDYTNGSIEDFSEEVYEYYNLGLGEERNCVLLAMSMSGRDYDLMAHGSTGNAAFTDYGKQQLANEFLDNFRNDDWAGGFRDYIETAGEYLEAAANGSPVDTIVYDDYTEPERGLDGFDIFLMIFIPCVISLIVCGVFAAQMKTARRQTGARNYIGQGGVDMRVSRDHFLYRTETRQRIQDDNDKGGGRPGGTTVNSGGFSHSSGKF